MSYKPFRPLCCYCGKPVTEDAWDHESQGYFSYGFSCMSPDKEGRFAVQFTDYGKPAEIRYSTLKRAEAEAAYLLKYNPGHTFTVVDRGTGTVSVCK